MEIKKIIENVYVLPGPTNVGVVASLAPLHKGISTHNVFLIDAGQNEDEGFGVLKALQELFPFNEGGFRVVAILLTHSHADHAGGASCIQKITNCAIWATEEESGSIYNTFLQPAVFWGGKPLKELTSSYYNAQSAKVTNLIKADLNIPTREGLISFVPLPGHYFSMVGVEYKNRATGQTVLFSSDAFFGRAHIAKYSIPYLYDVNEFLTTLEALDKTDYDWYIPSHGEILQTAHETLEMNQIAVNSTIESVTHALRGGAKTCEEVLKFVADEYSLKLKTRQYALILSTLRAYLKYLCDKGRARYEVVDNKLLFSLNK